MAVEYRYEATTVSGFLQQLAVAYLAHGYRFYVTGKIPEGKDPVAVDRKLLAKYDVGISKWVRARRKRAGLANCQYLRFDAVEEPRPSALSVCRLRLLPDPANREVEADLGL